MTALIICEKPSVAKKIANALGKAKKKSIDGVPYYELERNGKKIIVASAVGHLFTLVEKENKEFGSYPVFDIKWVPASVEKGKEYVDKYIKALKKLSKEADEFYIATDWDIEGELIGYHALKYCCGREKAKRMRFSSLTKKEIVKAFENPDEIDYGLVDAGESRHIVDWYFGINLSRALMNAIRAVNRWKTMSIGRVQGPALAFLTERELEIKKFVPKPYWVIEALFKGNLKAIHEKEKFWDEKEAKSVYEKIKDEKFGKVVEIKKTKRKIKPLPPFDLGTLQREAYSYFKISPKETQEIAQKLYEKGLCLHPDTLILLPDGIKKIKDLDDEGEILCLNKDLKLTKSKYKLLKRTIKEKLIKITLNDGTKLITTKEHPILVYRDELIFIPAEKLKENEQVVMFINNSEKTFKIKKTGFVDYILENKKYSHHYSIIYASDWKNKFKSGIAKKFDLSNQLSKNKGLSLDRLRKLSNYIIDRDLKRIANGDVYIQKIKKIEELEYEGEVYDLTVENYHNFIANGIVVHNCSYPRTSSQKLPKDRKYLEDILNIIKNHPVYGKWAERILKENLKPVEGKKEDPAHPAIHIVDIPKEELSEKEKKIYDLIARRTLAAFWDNAEREYLNIKVDIKGEKFKLSGSRTVKEGWHEIYHFPKFDEIELPALKKNDIIKVEKITITRKETQPPKRYTVASIIKELEKKGLGTKCLTSNTLIKVKIGSEIKHIKIEELFELLNDKYKEKDIELAVNNKGIKCFSFNYKDEVESSFEFISRRKLERDESVYRIRFEDGSFIEVTEKHPILIYDNGDFRYVKAKDLKKGMKVVSSIKYIGEEVINKDFITKTISSIRKIKYNGYVYDIINSEYSNFIANNIVVHNSTRAEIVDKLIKRGYVIDDGSLKVTDLGISVIETLKRFCPEIIDEKMTRDLEEKLEKIQFRKIKKDDVLEEAEKRLRKILEEFKKKEEDIGIYLIKNLDATNKKGKIVGKCPKCGGDLILIRYKKGRFVGCSNYPECDVKYSLPDKGRIKIPNKVCEVCKSPILKIGDREVCINPECPLKQVEVKEENRKCPKCGGDLILKKGIYGAFYGCSNYPKCKYTESINKKEVVGKCPKCGGDLVVRDGKFGKFVGCSNYPKCKYTEKL
ncbi:DNA topoisomerase I [Methanocaldococcus bathoardescens]|uniref:DNA topoisomerase 1 n=1 Tax=Methanocaldococcus bathoardescens TaxID=1301915 RepID=A0A076LKY0_9EURY|nr:DNA topoisomerase I [Methanocaldococcus bathoardescens]AIJ06319.1 DNA topoisomerase I [Methanocaldococcus bathoardescens]